MDKYTLITSTAVAATTGLAIWALLKLHDAREELRNLKDKYNDPKAVQKYLMHHYGSLNLLPLLKDFVSSECENFHQRMAVLSKLICQNYGTPTRRVLDVGSAAGATSFYLSEFIEEVVGADTSYFMINSCNQLKRSSEVACLFSNEGGCHCTPFIAKLPVKSAQERVTFWDEDVCHLVFSCGKFNCVVVANVLSELSEPKQFLSEISDYVEQEGLLIIADTYNWKNGPEIDLSPDDAMRSFDCLKAILSPKWNFLEDRNIPYFVANSERCAEVGNSHLTVWKRKSDMQEI